MESFLQLRGHRVFCCAFFMVAFLFISHEIIFAQGDPSAANRGNHVGATDFLESSSMKIKPSTAFEGTPYLTEEWRLGEVLLIDNLKTEKISLKLDTYNHEIHYKKDNQVYAVKNEYVKGLLMENEGTKLFFMAGFNSPEEKINPNTFLRVIYNGEVKLLVHHKTIIRQLGPSQVISNGGTKTHRFRHQEKYYIRTPDKKFHPVKKLKKKHVMEVLDKYDKQLERYAAENNLDFGEEEDLAKICAYYEQLLVTNNKY